MNPDIQSVFIRLAAGDINALDEIYTLFSLRVFNYVRTIVKNKQTAEDITHDVFLRVLGAAKRLANMQNPPGYVMTIARNLAYDEVRKNKFSNVPLGEMRDMTTELMYEEELPDALSALTPVQRETIYLHYICGFTQKEVARIMRVPLVTVKWRCKKAKQNLHNYFNEGGKIHETI